MASYYTHLKTSRELKKKICGISTGAVQSINVFYKRRINAVVLRAAVMKRAVAVKVAMAKGVKAVHRMGAKLKDIFQYK